MIEMTLYGDKITVVKKDGTRSRPVAASVQGEKVYTQAKDLDVEPGDMIVRKLPSGREERLTVIDPQYHQGPGGRLAHWKILCEREGRLEPQPSSVTYNVSGPQARVNIGSVDQSSNVIAAEAGATFEELRALLRTHVDNAEELNRLVRKVDQLEAAHGTAKFGGLYSEFMPLAANHLTVLAPILPALAQLL
jgi:hypothetical protein